MSEPQPCHLYVQNTALLMCPRSVLGDTGQEEQSCVETARKIVCVLLGHMTHTQANRMRNKLTLLVYLRKDAQIWAKLKGCKMGDKKYLDCLLR